jgi:hypothetical protein
MPCFEEVAARGSFAAGALEHLAERVPRLDQLAEALLRHR